MTNKNFAQNNIFKMKSNVNNVNLEDINLNNVSNHTPEVMAATLKADGNKMKIEMKGWRLRWKSWTTYKVDVD